MTTPQTPQTPSSRRRFRPNALTLVLALVLVLATVVGAQAMLAHLQPAPNDTSANVIVGTARPFRTLPNATQVASYEKPTPAGQFIPPKDDATPRPSPTLAPGVTPVVMPTPTPPPPGSAPRPIITAYQQAQGSDICVLATMGAAQTTIQVGPDNQPSAATVYDATVNKVIVQNAPQVAWTPAGSRHIQIEQGGGTYGSLTTTNAYEPMFQSGEQDALCLQYDDSTFYYRGAGAFYRLQIVNGVTHSVMRSKAAPLVPDGTTLAKLEMALTTPPGQP